MVDAHTQMIANNERIAFHLAEARTLVQANEVLRDNMIHTMEVSNTHAKTVKALG